uniref:Uncharacterized protein n=1 Tax=Sphaerodactylus townsendi TaxID=933632 RepID=A0ACB8FYY0_9SAUR
MTAAANGASLEDCHSNLFSLQTCNVTRLLPVLPSALGDPCSRFPANVQHQCIPAVLALKSVEGYYRSAPFSASSEVGPEPETPFSRAAQPDPVQRLARKHAWLEAYSARLEDGNGGGGESVCQRRPTRAQFQASCCCCASASS